MISRCSLVVSLSAVLALVDVAPRVVWAQSLTLEPVASDLGRPVDITHAGDGSGRLFIVLQDGRIVIHDGSGVLETPFLDINALVSCCRERGLLGLAFHPDYATNGWFYVNYTDTSGDTVIARYEVSSNPDRADPDSWRLVLPVSQPYPNHNGGQLRFGPDGYLYIAMGDGGGAGDPDNYAQNPEELLGKMLRLDVNGALPYTIPPDNPFVEDAGTLDEIWALGLRNPWRFSFDRLTGDLFIADVGQGGREEIDFQPAGSSGGENYGWRRMEGSNCFNPSSGCNDGSLVLPIIEYDHSEGDCSVTGGYRYRGAQLPPLSGRYLYADFCSGRIWTAAEAAGAGWTSFEAMETAERFTTFGEDQAGELYIAQLTQGGTVYRIGFTNPGDNDGDRRADLLWRNLETGGAVVWQMEGFRRKALGSIGAPDPQVWEIRGLADFNGDAKTDILWRNTASGNTVVWLMDGFAKRTGGLGAPSLDWRIVGTGDFDGDDRDDVLWRNTINGNTVIWKMEGLRRTAVGGLGALPEAWVVAGIGDFDADATSDILWRNTISGATVVWKIEGLARQSSAAIGVPDLTWQVRGVGKFDRDGHSDILWRNIGDGLTVIWKMNDLGREAVAPIGAPSAAWLVGGLGDTNGDGQSDVIWRNANSGEARVWQIDNLAKGDARSIGTVPQVWRVQ